MQDGDGILCQFIQVTDIALNETTGILGLAGNLSLFTKLTISPKSEIHGFLPRRLYTVYTVTDCVCLSLCP